MRTSSSSSGSALWVCGASLELERLESMADGPD
jgi:hypothetical protein